jgi:hypothetical protein
MSDADLSYMHPVRIRGVCNRRIVLRWGWRIINRMLCFGVTCSDVTLDHELVMRCLGKHLIE